MYFSKIFETLKPMAIATNLGFPRIGANRELKKSLESYWNGSISHDQLHQTAAAIRKKHWVLQKQKKINHIPSCDFSLYDSMLDMATLLGVVPERYQALSNTPNGFLEVYFAMARGLQNPQKNIDLSALEMTKWFDTNYHYIVPELQPNQSFHLGSTQPFQEYDEAQSLGISTRPVLIGPYTFLKLSKTYSETDSISLLPRIIPIYQEVLKRFQAQGVQWIQIDEPALVLDSATSDWPLIQKSYQDLSRSFGSIQILLATYFEGLHENLRRTFQLPLHAVHIDLVRAPQQLFEALQSIQPSQFLSLGIVDGRNVWKNNFDQSLVLLQQAADCIGTDRVMVAPSCSLLHSPMDVDLETTLDSDLKDWMAFATQKLEEVALLTQVLNEGESSASTALESNREAHKNRAASSRIHRPTVQRRIQSLQSSDFQRKSVFSVRLNAQQDHLNLPLFPTTTIGSFPQTEAIRKVRQQRKSQQISEFEYTQFMQEQIRIMVQKQEEIGLDVFVHGEPERNDMVEYFGEQLSGFVFTQQGWVQSYGSRCVKPPIIYGDVERTHPMTVSWSQFAQALTSKPMKGMLTGPVTILQWSFVRDDQDRSLTAKQIALAIRDEACDLEESGISVIQIDEPAIREGLPLHRSDWSHYLDWATSCFRLAASGVQDATQIHTHMCYSEFHEIMDSIIQMDADVITIEASRSHLELLTIFERHRYPNQIGPGVYDIHSPRVPSTQEIVSQLSQMVRYLQSKQIWVNPDCGLKTRRWDEVVSALQNMVSAAKILRLGSSYPDLPAQKSSPSCCSAKKVCC
jgi:5-methyltetrahydropteroyltriglutamate--homocysteine methyltransferase